MTLLVNQGFIKKTQIREVWEATDGTRQGFEKLVVNHEIISKGDLLTLKSAMYQVPSMDLLDTSIDMDVARILPSAMSNRYGVICTGREHERVVVAMIDPTDAFARDYIKMRTGFDVSLRVAYAGDLEETQAKVYAKGAGGPSPARATPKSPATSPAAPPARTPVAAGPSAPAAAPAKGWIRGADAAPARNRISLMNERQVYQGPETGGLLEEAGIQTRGGGTDAFRRTAPTEPPAAVKTPPAVVPARPPAAGGRMFGPSGGTAWSGGGASAPATVPAVAAGEELGVRRDSGLIGGTTGRLEKAAPAVLASSDTNRLLHTAAPGGTPGMTSGETNRLKHGAPAGVPAAPAVVPAAPPVVAGPPAPAPAAPAAPANLSPVSHAAPLDVSALDLTDDEELDGRILERLCLLGSAMHANLTEEVIAETLLSNAGELFDVEAACLMVLDRDQRVLYFRDIRGLETVKIPDALQEDSVGGWVFIHRQPVVISGVGIDDRHCDEIDLGVGFATQTLMAVPVFSNGMV
ncbi:MAG TPA: GAF domain-containing protein, partial [Candidatus Xenobia bacterium]